MPSDEVATEWVCASCQDISMSGAEDLSYAGSPLCSNETCENFDDDIDFTAVVTADGDRSTTSNVLFRWACPGCGTTAASTPTEFIETGSPICQDSGCVNGNGFYDLSAVDYNIDLKRDDEAERDLAQCQYVEYLGSDAERIACILDREHALTDTELAAVRACVASFDKHGVTDESAAAAARLSEALEDTNFSSESIALDAAVTRAKLRDDLERPLTLTEVWNLGFMHRHKPLDELTLERVTRPEFSNRFLVGLDESQRRRAPLKTRES